MNLFHVHAEKERGEPRGPQTWLVIADSLLEAMSFIPEDFSVKAVEVGVGAAAGPRRAIGWTGVSVGV